MSSELELLKNADIFHEVPEEQLAKLASRAIKRSYDPGEVIFRKGDPGSSAFVVEFGEIKISDETHTKKGITLAHKVEGEVFGELALYDGEPRSAHATATTDTRCLILKREDFLDVLDSESAMARAVIGTLSKLIRRMNMMLYWVDKHPQRRIVDALVAMTESKGHVMGEDEAKLHHVPQGSILIDVPVTESDLAENAQVYPGDVGPMLANLQYSDVIRRDGPTIIIVRPEEFQKAAHPPTWLLGS